MKDYQEKIRMNLDGSILKNWKEVLLFSLILAMIFFIVGAFIPPQYKATSSIVISQCNVSAMDAYREAKSSEFIARTGKEIILSNSFMEKVLSQSQVNWTEMNELTEQDRRLKFWRKKVKVAVIPNTGVMNISIYTKDKNLSKDLLTEIVAQLVSNKQVFLENKKVTASVTNEPYYFSKPAFPNLLLLTISGFIIGCLVAVGKFFILGGEKLFKWNAVKNESKKISDKEKDFEKTTFAEPTEVMSREETVTGRSDNQFVKIDEMEMTTSKKKDKRKKKAAEKINQLIESEDSRYFNGQFDKKKDAESDEGEVEKKVQESGEPSVKNAKSNSIKVAAPDDLPILEPDKKPSASDIANGYASGEASEEEVKDRLNQLLRGDM